MRFSVNHLNESSFETGLRPQYEYRDLGIEAATGGRVGAHVIRVRDPHAVSPEHVHDLEFHMIYLLKGGLVRAPAAGHPARRDRALGRSRNPRDHAPGAVSDDLAVLDLAHAQCAIAGGTPPDDRVARARAEKRFAQR
jgi:hypothetical protein